MIAFGGRVTIAPSIIALCSSVIPYSNASGCEIIWNGLREAWSSQITPPDITSSAPPVCALRSEAIFSTDCGDQIESYVKPNRVAEKLTLTTNAANTVERHTNLPYSRHDVRAYSPTLSPRSAQGRP